MKLNNIKIKNINKKLLAGALSFTLLTTGLVGCSTDMSDFNYNVNEQGEYEISGTIDYNLLKNYYFIVIENTNYDTTEYYICKKISTGGVVGPSQAIFYNIFSEYDDVYSDGTSATRKLLFEDMVANYLYATNNIKANYTKEDVEQILQGMTENYLKENNKKIG